MLSVCIVATVQSQTSTTLQTSTWSFRGEFIQAFSCELFCPCHWNATPDADFCKFNIAIRIKQGHYGNTRLDGLEIWLSGDFGGDLGDGEGEVVQFAFERAATHDQVDGVLDILSVIYPVNWKRIIGVARTAIEWRKDSDKAYAKRGDGKGEITLTFIKGSDKKTPVVINNLAYFASKKNYGFNLARANYNAKVGEDSFAFDNSNGSYVEVESSGTIEQ